MRTAAWFRSEERWAAVGLALLLALKLRYGGSVDWTTYFTQRGLGLFAGLAWAYVALSVLRERRPGARSAMELVRRGTEFVRDWTPFVLLIVTYENLLPLIRHVRPALYDPAFLIADTLLFGTTPSVWLEPFVTRARTEWFATFYLSLFALPLVSGGHLYLSGRRREFRQFMRAFTCVGFVAFIGYVALPVVGPRYFFPEQYRLSLSGVPLGEPALQSVSLAAADLADRVNARVLAGGPVPNCFPSLHTAWGLLVLLFAHRHARWLFFVYLVPVGSLIFATLYLRFHYFVDLLAGGFLATAVFIVSERWRDEVVGSRPNLLELPPAWRGGLLRVGGALRQRWPSLALLGLVGLVYGSSLPTGLTTQNRGQDGAELVAAAITGGTGHPPGYPLYCALVRLACRIFADSDPIDVAHALSAVFAIAAGLGVVALCRSVARSLQPRPPRWLVDAAAFVAGTSFCFSVTLFQQAVIAEVYALHALLITATTWFAAQLAGISGQRPSRRDALLFGACAGLSVSHHLSALPIVCVQAAIVLLCTRGQRAHRTFSAAAFAAGLLPWLYLPLSAARQPPLAWGQPDSLERWWWVLTGAQYRFRLSPELAGWGSRLLAGLPAGEMPAFVLALATSALAATLPRGAGSRLRAATLLLVGTASVNLLASSAYAIADLAPYFLPAQLAVAVLAGAGTAHVGCTLLRVRSESAARVFCVLAGVAAIGGSLLASIGRADAHGQHALDRQVRAIVREAPPGALIAARGDAMVFGLWYERFVRAERKDVDVVSRELLLQSWYAANRAHFTSAMRWPPAPLRGSADFRLGAVLRANYAARPIVVVHPADVPPGCGRSRGGLLRCGAELAALE